MPLRILLTSHSLGMTPSLVELVNWFAQVTEAQVQGNKVGSLNLEFRPKHRGSSKLVHKAIKTSSGSMAASSILTFQAIFPFLLMIGGNPKGDKLFDLHIDGATNCPDAPSFEYLDQVFLPAIQSYFGIEVICKLVRRGWGQMTPGTVRKGTIRIKFRPLEVGSTIRLRDDAKLCDQDGEDVRVTQGDGSEEIKYGSRSLDNYVRKVAVSIITPSSMHDLLKESLAENIERRFDGAEVEFKLVEDSGHCDRVYVLLVAHSEYCRWARDMINSESLKDKDLEPFAKELSSKLSKDLEDEVNAEVGGECPVDQFLQDQLVIFQTLAQGRSCFPRQLTEQTTEHALSHLHPDFPLVEDDPAGPMGKFRELASPAVRDETYVDGFGQNDSKHTLLARYVAFTILPKARFYNRGKVCMGAGVKVGEGVRVEVQKKQALEKQS